MGAGWSGWVSLKSDPVDANSLSRITIGSLTGARRGSRSKERLR